MGQARGFSQQSPSDPGYRGKPSENGTCDLETHAALLRQLHRRLSASGRGKLRGRQGNGGGGLGKRPKGRQAVRVRVVEESRVCPAPWEGEAGGAEQFNSVISEEGDCRKLKDCFLEGKLKSKGITLTTTVPILKIT